MDGGGAEAQVGLHVAAPLAHAVHLGLLDVQALLQGRRSDDRGDGQDALSADTGKYDVLFHFFKCLLRVWRHSRRLMITETPWYSISSRRIFSISG